MKMKKTDMLPVIAALVIAILVIPTAALPSAFAATPAVTGYLANVVTIPEDNAKLNMGMMVLGLNPTSAQTTISAAGNWYVDSLCTSQASTTALPFPNVVGPALSSEPMLAGSVTYYLKGTGSYPTCTAYTFAPAWNPLNYGAGMDLLSQHKILATLNGVPTKPDYLLCEVVEKEKAKIPPMTSKTPSLRQFPDEIIKTTLIDVTSNFICKVNWIKPGVGALDVYFVGPVVSQFIADHMLIVTAGYKVGKMTIWASELQDICILGWSMDSNVLSISMFPGYGLSTGTYTDTYYSWPNPMNGFVSCDEAAAWQLTYLAGGWPWATATS
jgi:hypothetical protein